jgi:hypothetical protein
VHGVAEQARDGERIIRATAPELDDETGIAGSQSTIT